MPIPVEPEDDEITNLFGDCLENCIFCDTCTSFWHLESNRPVCPMCSVKYEPKDIDNAPFNY